jgi:hypothetical protein
VWCHPSVIPALRRLRQENHESETVLGAEDTTENKADLVCLGSWSMDSTWQVNNLREHSFQMEKEWYKKVIGSRKKCARTVGE